MHEAFFVLLGLIFGSFGNMLIDRVPKGLSLGGRSRCFQCDRTLGALELVPVLSYLVLKGKCKTCKQPIGLRSQVTEVLSGIVFMLAAFAHTDVFTGLVLAAALWLLLIISIIDIQTRTISDALNIPFCMVSIIYNLLTGHVNFGGVLLAGGFFGALWLMGRGKWIGSGDVILGAGIGALVGTWSLAAMSLMLTYMIGALIIIVLLLARVITRQNYVPFAPFLAIGAYIVVLFEARVELLIQIYFGI